MKFSTDSIRKLFKAVDKSQKKHGQAVETALKTTGLYIQRESQKLCPVDTGALRNSAGTRSEGKGADTVVFVYYTMFYAVYVHENLFSYHKPPTQARFLEAVINEQERQILDVFEHAYAGSLQGKKAWWKFW